METRLGKIQSIKIGLCGAQLGVSIVLGSGKDCWGVQDCRSFWGDPPVDGAKWTSEQQRKFFGETFLWIGEILTAANKKTVDELVGVPVEVTFEDGLIMKSWRVLEEVI